MSDKERQAQQDAMFKGMKNNDFEISGDVKFSTGQFNQYVV